MPIQRDPALAPLSRDHHLALLLARGIQSDATRRLNADLPADLRALAKHVRKVFAEELAPHFEVEERAVLAAVRGRDAALDAVCDEIAREHVEMLALVARLADARLPEGDIEPVLDALGRTLEAHVRKEERTLFARAQELLDARELARVGGDVERHLKVHSAQE